MIVVVIIGIIAAIAIPKFSQGSTAAKEKALAGCLAELRSAIDRYQAEHDGVYPSAAMVMYQLCYYTNANGGKFSVRRDNGADKTVYGPYLRSIPAIPVGPYSKSKLISATGFNGVAWIYDGQGNVTANTGILTDSSGTLYSDY